MPVSARKENMLMPPPELIDSPDLFSDAARVLLASYKRFCQNLRGCMNDNPSASSKIVLSIEAVLLKLLEKYGTLSRPR
jgi:hypothetical protein